MNNLIDDKAVDSVAVDVDLKECEKKEQLETKQSEEVLDGDKSQEENTNNKTGWKKKARYDGKWKKRQWVQNNRDRRNNDASDEKRARFNPEDRVKRRKHAMLLAYAGANYYGAYYFFLN